MNNYINEDFLIISPQLAIGSMMHSGYKDAAYAVAELIDNSIQAGESIASPVDVQVISVEKDISLERRCRQIEYIAVYDNASGMSKDVLRKALQFGGSTRRNAEVGMGKFGMGLPNASISQCNKVEVYSWQESVCYYTYLDIQEIENGEYKDVPDPIVKEIPENWKKRIESKDGAKIGKSGTLVIWSSLERMKWKRHKAFFDNTEFLIGRIYRHFINDKKCSIRLVSFSNAGKETDRMVVPNDPLYLMSGTNSPEEFAKVPAFVALGVSYVMSVNFKGRDHEIVIRASYAPKATREKAHHGSHPLSDHCKRNTGISLLRAGRELELNTSFVRVDPTERWWGIEVSFPPSLDEVFGVTNNKQAATRFKRYTKEDAAAEEGTSLSEIMEVLEGESDPMLFIVQLTIEIERILKGLRKYVEETRVAQRKAEDEDSVTSAEEAANKIVETRKEEGRIGESDRKEEEQTEQEKKADLEKEIDKKPLTEEEKKQTLKEYMEKGKFVFEYVNTVSPAYSLVDISRPAGKLKVSINVNHPAWKNIEGILDDLDMESSDKVKDSITLLFAALVRAEDEITSETIQEKIEEFRLEWGRIARDMIRSYNGEK